VIVAGIIVFAGGLKETIHEPAEPLEDASRLALCGELAMYLLGIVAFRMRMAGTVSGAKPAGAIGLLVLFSALWITAGAVLVLGALCALESLEPALTP
jgi:low temperature requirement protein LtrA